MKNFSSLFKQRNTWLVCIVLLVFWIVIDAQIEFESIILGLIAVISIMYLNRDLAFSSREIGVVNGIYMWRFLKLVAFLVIEVVKSNIQVAKIVLHPKMPIQPSFVTIPVKPKKDFHKVVYGNVITLTPGTLTVDVTKNGYIVHTLTEETKADLKNNPMEERVMQLEVNSHDD
ncbi:multicomponent Na+:H+ antiporter subunit E [Natronobacillus azotifigens]|uniref:Na+/H+ antiporter subunit E n=1 Tax=Natronobacillus azotifigens TaxID=472978 RepID=A0A9J6R8I2_9BACI|nr:Na+/H+ antiporter subunit E [Natronobacillus azotifigens]MCZ0701941.1 Na+/H+ antiporter subunit E [Natronobacillus azotifigens]